MTALVRHGSPTIDIPDPPDVARMRREISTRLQPGMALVLEPVVWTDGTGGYRSEETIVTTDDGYVFLTDYPYTPYGS